MDITINGFTDYEEIEKLGNIFLKPTTCEVSKQHPLISVRNFRYAI